MRAQIRLRLEERVAGKLPGRAEGDEGGEEERPGLWMLQLWAAREAPWKVVE